MYNILGDTYNNEGMIILSLRDDALYMHKEKQGKLGVYAKVKVTNKEELSLAYSPGVAEPCKDIHEDVIAIVP